MAQLLTFRLPERRLVSLTARHLQVGLFFAWLVGMGRYWDNPRAHLGQHLGIGSVVYVFVLSALLWVFFKPISPRRVRYRDLAAFISLTAAPALLYAIPVERFLSLSAAATANVWFLAVVALWRVGLLSFFMVRALRFAWYEVLFAGLVPLALIVGSLAVLNLEHVVFRIMAGLAPEERTANDSAHGVLVLLTILSLQLAPLLILGYLACIGMRIRSRRQGIDDPAP
jgi:hypothetical protein